jgi:hypothetical protein
MTIKAKLTTFDTPMIVVSLVIRRLRRGKGRREEVDRIPKMKKKRKKGGIA